MKKKEAERKSEIYKEQYTSVVESPMATNIRMKKKKTMQSIENFCWAMEFLKANCVCGFFLNLFSCILQMPIGTLGTLICEYFFPSFFNIASLILRYHVQLELCLFDWQSTVCTCKKNSSSYHIKVLIIMTLSLQTSLLRSYVWCRHG